MFYFSIYYSYISTNTCFFNIFLATLLTTYDLRRGGTTAASPPHQTAAVDDNVPVAVTRRRLGRHMLPRHRHSSLDNSSSRRHHVNVAQLQWLCHHRHSSLDNSSSRRVDDVAQLRWLRHHHHSPLDNSSRRQVNDAQVSHGFGCGLS
jgi:hypothetical protein